MSHSGPSSMKRMSLAMVLFRYFPYGGMQSNFLRIAKACVARGHRVDVYTLDWQGEQPQDLTIHIVKVSGRRNIRRYEDFSERIHAIMQQRPYDLLMGFNRMPGLDLYYAADPCFVERVRKTRPWYYPLGARYRHFKAFEQALFGPDSDARILALSQNQIDEYQQYYNTSPGRFCLLPPGVQAAYRHGPEADAQRVIARRQLGLNEQHHLLLMVGSGFERKGVDRSLRALAMLEPEIRANCHLLIIGKGREKPLQRLARRLGVDQQLTVLSGSDEVPMWMQGADLLLHPARSENTGNVIVEAIAGGLPVLCSATCGYAFHVQQADAGKVLDEPYSPSQMSRYLSEMLQRKQQQRWSENALAYAQEVDLYGRLEIILDEIERGVDSCQQHKPV